MSPKKENFSNMNTATVITSVLTLAAGIGIFLIACTMMSTGLEALGSGKLKALFAKTSDKKLVGVGVGAAATAAIQSSSATTVMTIGFVNAGIMTLAQAAAVIFGANVGTTITGQLVALGMFGGNTVSVTVIFAALTGIGAFILAFAKKDRLQKIGGITAGFGMLFVGLSMMSGSMEAFSTLDSVRNFLASFRNPLLLVLVGMLLTAAVQSSSVMTGMTITMVVTELITLNQGIYITMGANVGTCVTALIAGMTGTKNAKRTALIHVIFNVGGVLVFMLLGLFLHFGNINYGWLFAKMFPHAPQIQLAMFHTIFNVVTVLLILPLTNPLVKLVTKLIPDKKNKQAEEQPHLYYAEEHLLKTPPIAIQQTKNEILHMAAISMENFTAACNMICTLDFTNRETFEKNEKLLNFLQSELVSYMVKLSRADLNEKDRAYLSTAFRTVTDLERVGDYAENIVEYADNLNNANQCFSSEAVEEIQNLHTLIDTLYTQTMTAYKDCDRKALESAYQTEDEVDRITEQMAENHIRRLNDGVCTPDVGAQYLSLSANAERVADHYINVAKSIRAYTHTARTQHKHKQNA